MRPANEGPRAPSTPLDPRPDSWSNAREASRHSVPVLIDHRNPSHPCTRPTSSPPHGLGASETSASKPATATHRRSPMERGGDRLRHRTEPAALSSNCHRPVCRRPAPLLPQRVAQQVAQALFPVRLQHVSAEELPYRARHIRLRGQAPSRSARSRTRCARCARFDRCSSPAVPVPGAWPKRRSHHRPMARSPQSAATSGGLRLQPQPPDRSVSGRKQVSP